MKRKYFITIFTVLAVGLLSLTGCLFNPPEPLPNPKVTILNHRWTCVKAWWTENMWTVNIQGLAINDGNKHFYHVEIKARLYTSTGEVIGELSTEKHTGKAMPMPIKTTWGFGILEEIYDLEPVRYDIWVEQMKW